MFTNKHSLKELGWLNLLISIPAILAPTFLGLGLIFIQQFFNLESIPVWIENAIFIPALIAPISCIYGIVVGIIYRKEKHSTSCITMSITGILIFAFLVWFLLLLANYN